jgi:maltose O-acetyltransferase
VITAKRYFVNLLLTVLPPTRFFALKRFLWGLIGVHVGLQSKINSGAKIWGPGPVFIGEACWLGMNLTIIVPEGAEVFVGSNVDIAPDVLLECGFHVIGDANRRAGTEQARSIQVGSGTWIGCRATLLAGASLGTGTVVAAGALVTAGEYPPNVLLGGVPARILRALPESETTDS